MLTNNFPTHIHYVPPQHGVLLFRGLQMLTQHANCIYNKGLAENDNKLTEMATKLIIDIQECMTAQFDNYSVEHLSQTVFSLPKKAAE